jgi:hypothetical protein
MDLWEMLGVTPRVGSGLAAGLLAGAVILSLVLLRRKKAPTGSLDLNGHR